MKKSLIILLLFVFEKPCFAQVEGDIVDEMNRPVTNAVLVAIDSTGKFRDSVKTDERGFYFFQNLKPAKYKIQAKAPGFLTVIVSFVVMPAPEDSNEGDDTYHADVLDIILKRPKK